MTSDRHDFDLSRAESLGYELLGLTGRATALPSERDQNFLLTVDGTPTAVLKIANVAEDRALLRGVQRAMMHVRARCSLIPSVLPLSTGETFVDKADDLGRPHMTWAVAALEGVPLGSVTHRTPTLFTGFGAVVAEVTTALEGFDDEALHREFHWDLARGREVVAQFRALVTDADVGVAIDVLMARFDTHTQLLLAALPRSVIHGDLNDFNVLVGRGTDLLERNQRITGVLDFGDAVFGITVGDLAIAIAYAMLDSPDPLSVLWQMTHGYHGVRALSDGEMEALFGLAALRLCMSACLAARQMRDAPDNAYLAISQAPLRRTLPRLARVPFAFAAATVRSACGLEPVAGSARVRDWLAEQRDSLAPVLGVDLRTQSTLVLDLSVGSALVSGDARNNSEPAVTERVFATMRREEASVAIGRYDEPRLLYVTPAFAAGDGTLDEHRTIHIGLDLFMASGTPVFAPLDGVVHAADEHRVALDYGGVVVLRHETADGTEFFTLYGHLSAASFAPLRVGQHVARGEEFAALGTPEENGGWTPHLHLQIITDFLGLGSDFPGVGTPSRRDVWRSVSPDANLLVGVPANRFPRVTPPLLDTFARRRALIGSNVSIAYRRPVRVVRGWRHHLYDDEGRRFLDAYNNVPHVGHCHPRVVDAAARQMSVLNTNTRYLHDGLEDYAERLAATLPAPLEVCFFVSSASEANELALRIARTSTGRRDMLVLDAAYHGNTSTLVDISPYKHNGPGGTGTPAWVHVAPLADDYRGPYKRSDPMAGAKYAADLTRQVGALQAGGVKLAAFIAESCPSVGGQIVFPPGYLRGAYETVRAAGGVCIADEVQTGLGRLGTHFWGFESQGVVPDIVVMGKPLGNGHPLAAVVTTRALADAFDNGMEYFSTFGGNTVACAVGSEVLDVMRDEALQESALRVGALMLDGFRSLAAQHPLIGDVRGSGLFLGIELVQDRTSMRPAAEEASYVSNRLRDRGILIGTDGPYHNVVKIRPPMTFDAAAAERVLGMLDVVFRELSFLSSHG